MEEEKEYFGIEQRESVLSRLKKELEKEAQKVKENQAKLSTLEKELEEKKLAEKETDLLIDLTAQKDTLETKCNQLKHYNNELMSLQEKARYYDNYSEWGLISKKDLKGLFENLQEMRQKINPEKNQSDDEDDVLPTDDEDDVLPSEEDKKDKLRTTINEKKNAFIKKIQDLKVIADKKQKSLKKKLNKLAQIIDPLIKKQDNYEITQKKLENQMAELNSSKETAEKLKKFIPNYQKIETELSEDPHKISVIENADAKNTEKKTIIIVGRSRIGKSTALEVMRNQLYIAPFGSIFAGTQSTYSKKFIIADARTENQEKVYEITFIDTPGLFENAKIGKSPRTNIDLLNNLKEFLHEKGIITIDRILFPISFFSGLNIHDVEAMTLFTKFFNLKAGLGNVGILMTRSENNSQAAKLNFYSQFLNVKQLKPFKDLCSSDQEKDYLTLQIPKDGKEDKEDEFHLKMYMFWIGAPAESDYSFGDIRTMKKIFGRIKQMRDKLYDWIFDESIPPIQLNFEEPQTMSHEHAFLEKETKPEDLLTVLQKLLQQLRIKLIHFLTEIKRISTIAK
jgi:GTP-binding protein EngB required for normal cell division